MRRKKVSLFEPIEGKPMLEAYPELAKYEEFRNLSDSYIRFAWYFGNKSSPYYNEKSHYKKVRFCFDAAFGRLTANNQGIGKKLQENDFPEELVVAIERMRLFNPSIRDKALTLQEKIFAHYETIIGRFEMYVTEESDENGNNKNKMSISATKDYVELTAKINKELPTLILNLEEGFGIKRGKDEIRTDETSDELESILD